MLVVDTETVGLTGPVVTVQWSELSGPVHVHHVWEETAGATLKLLDQITERGILGFNITFEAFQLQRMYNVLSLLPADAKPTAEGWVKVARQAVWGDCMKPRHVHDVFLHARKGPYQSLMERDDIRVRKVPRALAPALAAELQSRITLDGIYFSRRRDGYRWEVLPLDDDPEFADVVLRFGASSGLKALARHVLKVEALDLPVPREIQPQEQRWNIWGLDWVRVLPDHVRFWRQNTDAIRYAREDVEFTRDLWQAFGSPDPDDTDSVLAWQVGASRWRGWSLNLEKLHDIKRARDKEANAVPTAPRAVLSELHKRCTQVEAIAIQNTNATTLNSVAKWGADHPASVFVRQVQRARSAEKFSDICRKLLTTQRAHFDFKVIGTLSGRMSGASGLNPQGIPAKGGMRDAFTLYDCGEDLQGGDFDAFEVSLAAAVYDDERLNEDLRTGKKIHALFGSAILGESYDEVMASPDKYKRGKIAFLGKMYGAELRKIAEVFNRTQEQVAPGVAQFESNYPGVAEARKLVAEKFCGMTQPDGIGTRILWRDPADYVESLFGFRRYFTLENEVCRILFELAQNPPSGWADLPIKVVRRDREQRASGATQSALYACAFGLQARNMRAAANHTIQSSGAHITKELQAAIWALQPYGFSPWVVRPMNIHDEVISPSTIDLRDTVSEVVEGFRGRVPLLAMEWKTNQPHWGALK